MNKLYTVTCKPNPFHQQAVHWDKININVRQNLSGAKYVHIDPIPNFYQWVNFGRGHDQCLS